MNALLSVTRIERKKVPCVCVCVHPHTGDDTKRNEGGKIHRDSAESFISHPAWLQFINTMYYMKWWFVQVFAWSCGEHVNPSQPLTTYGQSAWKRAATATHSPVNQFHFHHCMEINQSRRAQLIFIGVNWEHECASNSNFLIRLNLGRANPAIGKWFCEWHSTA